MHQCSPLCTEVCPHNIFVRPSFTSDKWQKKSINKSDILSFGQLTYAFENTQIKSWVANGWDIFTCCCALSHGFGLFRYKMWYFNASFKLDDVVSCWNGALLRNFTPKWNWIKSLSSKQADDSNWYFIVIRPQFMNWKFIKFEFQTELLLLCLIYLSRHYKLHRRWKGTRAGWVWYWIE